MPTGIVRFARGRAPRQPRGDRLRAVVVEAHPVDHRLLARIAEDPRPRVARLGQRGHRPDLDVPEAERRRCGPRTRVLVEARGEADRVGKVEPERLTGRKLAGDNARPSPPATGSTGGSAREAPWIHGQFVGPLRLEAEKHGRITFHRSHPCERQREIRPAKRK